MSLLLIVVVKNWFLRHKKFDLNERYGFKPFLTIKNNYLIFSGYFLVGGVGIEGAEAPFPRVGSRTYIHPNKKTPERIFLFVGRIGLDWNLIVKELAEWYQLFQLVSAQKQLNTSLPS